MYLERCSALTTRRPKTKRNPEGFRFIESYLERNFPFMLALEVTLLVFLER